MMRLRAVATMTALAVGLLAAAPELAAAPAEAPAPVELDDDAKVSAKAEVLILHATNDGKGLDPAIGDLPQLKQPPFSAYDSYKLLSKEKPELTKGKQADVALPTKSNLGLTLESIDKAKRYGLNATIKGKDGKVFLPGVKWTSAKGEYFFLAGQKYKEGILVLGIRIAQ